MDLNEYFAPLKKWWWMLAAAALLAGVTSFFVARMQPPVYQAHTTLMVGQTIENPNPTSGDFFLAQSLAGVYADMGTREPVRTATMKALGLTWLPTYVSQPVPNSQMLEILVTDSNPKRAMLVASELARQLVLRSPNAAASGEVDRQAFLNDQLNSLQIQITGTEGDVVTLQKQLGGLTSAKQIADTQNQITALQAKLATLQGNYANLLASTQKGAINSLTIVEAAELPTAPANQNRVQTIALAVIIGIVMASAGAYGIEFFDRTLKTEADISRVMKLPVLGYIAEMEDKGNEFKYFMLHPHTPTAHAFRSLRGNIDFSSVDGPLKTIFVSSFEASSGKTTVASNLALAFLSGAKQVILVDADPYRPRVHERYDLPIKPGLSDILNNQADENSAIQLVPDMPGLRVITAGEAGKTMADPGIWKIDSVLSSLEKQADIVIVDGPPILVPDGAVLASQVDGVVMVLRPGTIHPDAARAAMEQLNRAKANVLGVVLNRISRVDANGYPGYSYNSPYHTDGQYYFGSEHENSAKQNQPIGMKIKSRIKKTFPSNHRSSE